ncbi:MAG: uracil phosphoribosyltransferase [Bacteroidia bacterium]|nr:uracil phosphoribosyltransferase [Bacteroidia bacterium]
MNESANLHILNRTNSLISHYLEQIRNTEKQNFSMRFRENVNRIGRIMAYEISKQLEYAGVAIQTPLCETREQVMVEQPVLVTVLRAGLAFHQGFLEMFDEAPSGFVSAYRHHTNKHEFEVIVEYLATPSLDGKVVLIIDPMLATGQSMHLAAEAIAKNGKPAKLIFASLIAAPEGIAFLREKYPEIPIYTAALDSHLNEFKYIVPGLGDAGDLAYGEKMEA